MNAVADETRIAERPTVAKARCTSVPTWMPSTEARPAPRPWWMLRVTMYTTAGPGTARIASAASANTASVWGWTIMR